MYYTDLENSNGNGLKSQASAAWPSLNGPEYNYDVNVENDVQVGNEGEYESAATENGEVGNEGENEENDLEFVDSDYEFSEQEDEVLVAENVAVSGPSGEPNAGENVA